MPKTELHIHIEGSLEPELMFALAEKNKISLPFKTVKEVRSAYNFTDLQSFLDIYYRGAEVLQKEEDFYDLTWDYLKKINSQNVRHTEIFFDPQTHTQRGIQFETVINGITNALKDAKKQLDISSKLIMCFLRHLSEKKAMKTLKQAVPFKSLIIGVGLDSAEIGNPPGNFINVFKEAQKEGFITVAHAGEEGPAEYIWEALEKLKVARLDHGIQCTKDPELVKRLAAERIPLTVCPLSNVKLKVFNSMPEHNLKQLLDSGLCITINSDDPAYFGGYVTENYLAIKNELNLDKKDIYTLAKNGIEAAFISAAEKKVLTKELDTYFNH